MPVSKLDGEPTVNYSTCTHRESTSTRWHFALGAMLS